MDYTYNYEYSVGPEATAGLGILSVGISLAIFLFFVIFYVYMAVCLMKIAKKTGTDNAWFAWIPILNLVLMIQIAQKPMWWLIFFLVPLLNLLSIVFGILIWMAISERLGKPSWLGILMIVPIANFIIPGYLAFSSPEQPANYQS